VNADTALALTIGLPLAGAIAIVLLDRYPNLRETATLLVAGALFAAVVRLWFAQQGGEHTALVMIETLPGVPLALAVEPLGLLFALVASFLWIATSVYSIGYMRAHHERHQTRFYAAFAVALASTMGVAFAANLFTLFLCYEALTLSTYPLVTHAGTAEARRAGRVYLGLLLGTSIGLLLLAIVWTWMLAGTLDFRVGGILRASASPATIAALYALYLFGIGKAAIMPFHRWLPAAMVAPTPVSALLHAVAVVKAGVFTVLKVTVYVFGIDLLANNGGVSWLLYVAAATILIASLVAMRQDDLKLRLAYSTVSQLGYVVLGAVLANAGGIVGGAMHIAMHAFGKITLFFCSGAILVAAQKTKISQMRGLGRAMPITMSAFFVCSLSIIGLPPMGGMWSKWFLALGTLDAGNLTLLAVLMISTLLNVAYLLPIPVRAFFSSSPGGASGIKEGPFPCLLALVITTLGCMLLFFYPDPVYRLASQIISR
jgi:multicomponent Na+:H+ antiporter subunit D